VVDNAGDVVTENLNEGIDTVTPRWPATPWGQRGKPGRHRQRRLTGTGNALANQIVAAWAPTPSTAGRQRHPAGGVGNDTCRAATATTALKAASGQPARRRRRHRHRAGAGQLQRLQVTRPNATDTVLTHATSGEVLTLRNVEFVSFNGTLMAIHVQLNIPAWQRLHAAAAATT
jgi:hypothetical protein